MLQIPEAFTWQNALDAARIADAAYGSACDFSDTLIWDEAPSRLAVNLCYHDCGGDVTAVGIQGTTNILQWAGYALLHRLERPWGDDRGVFKPFWEIAAWAGPTIAVRVPRERRLVLCGHSLGGSVAMIAAAMLKAEGRHVAAYTFGQPYTGNAAFAGSYAPTLFRIWNTADKVPKLPQIVAFGAMVHAGLSLPIDGPRRLVGSHLMSNYLESIRGLAA